MCTPRALSASSGQEISTESGDYTVETPEGYGRPGEKRASFGVYVQNMTNYLNHQLGISYITIGMNPY